MNDQADISLDAVTVEAEDAVEAFPPRYWWLKRLSIACALMLVGLIGLRLYWGWEADRRLQIQIAKYRADGQPVLPSEFDALLDAVPDDENAAILLEKAMNKIVATAKDGTNFEDFRDDPTLFDTNMSAAREIIDANEPVFALVREGLKRPQVAWNGRLSNFFTTGTAVNRLPEKRQLAKLLYFSISYHMQKIDGTVDALLSLQMLLDLEHASASHPTLISNLVAIASGAFACNLMEEFSSSLNIPPFRQNQMSSVYDSRKLVANLIKGFLDDEKHRKAFSYAMRGEIGVQLDIMQLLMPWNSGGPFMIPAIQATITDKIYDIIVRPLNQLEIIANLEVTAQLERAASERSWRAAEALFPETSHPETMIEWMVQPMRMTFGPPLSSLERSFFLHFKHLARRHLAATALAIGLYHADLGQRPELLEQLVPDYWPAVPLDPFSPNDETIRYILHDEHPRLYSVGANGTDDIGTKDSNKDVDGRTYKSDILFYLDGKPKDIDKH